MTVYDMYFKDKSINFCKAERKKIKKVKNFDERTAMLKSINKVIKEKQDVWIVETNLTLAKRFQLAMNKLKGWRKSA